MEGRNLGGINIRENQNPQQDELPPLPESLPYHGQAYDYQTLEFDQSEYPFDHQFGHHSHYAFSEEEPPQQQVQGQSSIDPKGKGKQKDPQFH
uniref:Uncharacterized protein n=1 Tax=Meloidogyne floridensis TaxID=298350 RepID=A0A915NNU6_9BILA